MRTPLKLRDEDYTIVLNDVTGQEKILRLSKLVRIYPANALSTFQNWACIFRAGKF